MDCGILQEFRQETFQAGPLGFPLPLSLLLTPVPSYSLSQTLPWSSGPLRCSKRFETFLEMTRETAEVSQAGLTRESPSPPAAADAVAVCPLPSPWEPKLFSKA